MKKEYKLIIILNIISSILNYMSAFLNFYSKNSTMGVCYFALGTTFLCTAVLYKNSNKKEEENHSDK